MNEKVDQKGSCGPHDAPATGLTSNSLVSGGTPDFRNSEIRTALPAVIMCNMYCGKFSNKAHGAQSSGVKRKKGGRKHEKNVLERGRNIVLRLELEDGARKDVAILHGKR